MVPSLQIHKRKAWQPMCVLGRKRQVKASLAMWLPPHAVVSTRMYQHILSLCLFSVYGNRHGWLIQDNIWPADSFVFLSAVCQVTSPLNMHSATLCWHILVSSSIRPSGNFVQKKRTPCACLVHTEWQSQQEQKWIKIQKSTFLWVATCRRVNSARIAYKHTKVTGFGPRGSWSLFSRQQNKKLWGQSVNDARYKKNSCAFGRKVWNSPGQIPVKPDQIPQSWTSEDVSLWTPSAKRPSFLVFIWSDLKCVLPRVSLILRRRVASSRFICIHCFSSLLIRFLQWQCRVALLRYTLRTQHLHRRTHEERK